MLQASLWSLGLKSELVSSIETSGYKKKEGVAARAQVESDSVELPLLSCFFHFCFDPNHQISHSLSPSLCCRLLRIPCQMLLFLPSAEPPSYAGLICCLSSFSWKEKKVQGK